MAEAVPLGFVGVGGRGRGLLSDMLGVDGAKVVAICDPVAENREKAKDQIVKAGQPAPKEYSKWSDLLADGSVQAVVSALPCDLHAQHYLDTIAAGKDLYGEKPMAITPESCAAVVSAANASSQIVQIGFQRRADPRFIETMGQIHAGELGTLVEGRIAWSNSWGPLYGWFGETIRSGDWMLEQACHNWDVMNWACQSLPKRAIGMGRKGLFKESQPDRDVHDYYSALVEYENGLIVNILHSWVTPGQAGAMKPEFNHEYTRLIGTIGGIDFNSGTFSYRREVGLPDRIGHSHEGSINNTQLGLDAFLNSVRHRTPPVANVEHGRDSVLACMLVREAVIKGGEVTMAELIG